MLLKLAFAGIAGYAIYAYGKRNAAHGSHVAFAAGETAGPNFAKVRNAGPEAMRSDPPQWDTVDEASDESFPSSDPPGTY